MGPTLGDVHTPAACKDKKKKFRKMGRLAGKPLTNAERMQRVEAARARWRGHVALAGAGAGVMAAAKAKQQDPKEEADVARARKWGVLGGAAGGAAGALAGGLAGGGIASLGLGLAGSSAGDAAGRAFFERLAYAGSATGLAQFKDRLLTGLPDEDKGIHALAAEAGGSVAGSALGRKIGMLGRFTGTRGRLVFDTLGTAAGEFAGGEIGRRYFGKSMSRPLSEAERRQRSEAAKARWRNWTGAAVGTVAGAALGHAFGSKMGRIAGKSMPHSTTALGSLMALRGAQAGFTAGNLLQHRRQAWDNFKQNWPVYAGVFAGRQLGQVGGALLGAKGLAGRMHRPTEAMARVAQYAQGGTMFGGVVGGGLAIGMSSKRREQFKQGARERFSALREGRGLLNVGKSDVVLKGEIAKVDDEERIVYGFASVTEENGKPVVDRQGDRMSTKELVKAAHAFMSKRHGKVMHNGKAVGEIVESVVLRPEIQKALGMDLKKTAWLIGYKVHDDETWARVKKGELPAFSIGGKGKRKKVDT